MNKILTIVIPVYNLEEYLERCVDSITSQYFKDDLEIIIINDGSTDNSLNIANQLKEKDSRIIVFNSTNQGVSRARNWGISKASGKYISFIDADDYLNNNWVDIFKLLNTNYELIICKSFTESGNNLIENYSFKEINNSDAIDGISLFRDYNYVRGSVTGVIFKLDFLIKDKNIKFIEGLKNSEDTIFFVLAQYYAKQLKLVDIDFYRVIKRDGSASSVYTSSVALNQFDSLRYLKEYLKNLGINYYNIPIFNFLFYTLITNSISRLVKSNDFNKEVVNEALLKIKKAQILPLNTAELMKNKFKFKLLNFSPSLAIWIYKFLK